MSSPLLRSVSFALVCFTFVCVPAVEAQRRGSRVIESNKYAPELYADKLEFIATLVDLPGALHKQSRWEISYQLYFISEAKYNEAFKRFPRGGFNATIEQFPGRVLIAEGRRKQAGLATLKDRTIVFPGIVFKRRVPDAERTKFATLITSYSIKVFDGELKTNVYTSGLFLGRPFDQYFSDDKQDAARSAVYLTCGLNREYGLQCGQIPPRK